MRCACELGKRLAAIPEDLFEKYEAMIKTFPRPPLPPLDANELIAAMRFDKKVLSGTLAFVVPTAAGFSIIKSDALLNEVRKAIEAG